MCGYIIFIHKILFKDYKGAKIHALGIDYEANLKITFFPELNI